MVKAWDMCGMKGPPTMMLTATLLVPCLSVNERRSSVKPSAQPTLVRTQHLPPPAQTARDRGILPSRGPSWLVSSSVIVGQETPLHHGGYGHIPDGSGAEGAVRRTACCVSWWLSKVGRLCARQDAKWLLSRARSLDPIGHSWSQLIRRALAKSWQVPGTPFGATDRSPVRAAWLCPSGQGSWASPGSPIVRVFAYQADLAGTARSGGLPWLAGDPPGSLRPARSARHSCIRTASGSAAAVSRP